MMMMMMRMMLSIFNSRIEIKGHILRVNNAMNVVQCNLDLLINSTVNAQKGIVQPQVIFPWNLVESLIKSNPAFPEDTTLPFPLNKDSYNFISRICNILLMKF
jgi:hypothetical protein